MYIDLRQHHIKMNIKDITLLPILAVSITIAKISLSFIPNVEFVSLLLIVYTIVLGFRKTLIISTLFTTIEILIYGFGIWVIGYYWIWPILIILVTFFKPIIKTEYGWAFLSGSFGMIFGFLFAIHQKMFTEVNLIAHWVAGLPLDIVHMASNFILTLLLFKPLYNLINKLYKEFKY